MESARMTVERREPEGMARRDGPKVDLWGTEGSEVSREAKFWTCRDEDEVLTCTDPEEAAQDFIDNMDPDAPIPAEVTVYGFAPMELDAARFADGWLIELLLERMDEEHGNPNEATKITEAMRAAERSFVEAIARDFKVWSCEQVAITIVQTKDLDLPPPASPAPEQSGRSPAGAE